MYFVVWTIFQVTELRRCYLTPDRCRGVALTTGERKAILQVLIRIGGRIDEWAEATH